MVVWAEVVVRAEAMAALVGVVLEALVVLEVQVALAVLEEEVMAVLAVAERAVRVVAGQVAVEVTTANLAWALSGRHPGTGQQRQTRWTHAASQ